MKLLHAAQVDFGGEGGGKVTASSAIEWDRMGCCDTCYAGERVHVELQHSDQRSKRRNRSQLRRLACAAGSELRQAPCLFRHWPVKNRRSPTKTFREQEAQSMNR
jgi:hypothetical protein